jgi:hypothetical protein
MRFPAASLNGDGSMSHAANSATTSRTALSSETTTRTHARCIDLTRIRRENPAFNYGFFRPNSPVFEREVGKNAGHGSEFTRVHRQDNPKLLEQMRGTN